MTRWAPGDWVEEPGFYEVRVGRVERAARPGGRTQVIWVAWREGGPLPGWGVLAATSVSWARLQDLRVAPPMSRVVGAMAWWAQQGTTRRRRRERFAVVRAVVRALDGPAPFPAFRQGRTPGRRRGGSHGSDDD